MKLVFVAQNNDLSDSEDVKLHEILQTLFNQLKSAIELHGPCQIRLDHRGWAYRGFIEFNLDGRFPIESLVEVTRQYEILTNRIVEQFDDALPPMKDRAVSSILAHHACEMPVIGKHCKGWYDGMDLNGEEFHRILEVQQRGASFLHKGILVDAIHPDFLDLVPVVQRLMTDGTNSTARPIDAVQYKGEAWLFFEMSDAKCSLAELERIVRTNLPQHERKLRSLCYNLNLAEFDISGMCNQYPLWTRHSGVVAKA